MVKRLTNRLSMHDEDVLLALLDAVDAACEDSTHAPVEGVIRHRPSISAASPGYTSGQ